MGRGANQHIVYMIDFGLANRYIDPKTGVHISYRSGKKLVGTARYASINTHLGIEQSCRDDLESLGYLVIYLLTGNLPWSAVGVEDKEGRVKRIGEVKMDTTMQKLCREVPEQVAKYVDCCRELQFTEVPDYGKLRRLFKDLLMKKGEFYDYKYDWVPKPEALKVKVETVSDNGTWACELVAKKEAEARKELTNEARVNEAKKYFYSAFHSQSKENLALPPCDTP